ncbi:MAG TPA: Holliday junction resolvase RecU [Pyrinomonadaceae bacterium]
MPVQDTIPGIDRPTAAGNRGKLWEEIVERTCDGYRRQGLGVIRRNPRTWDYAPAWLWDRCAPVARARTGDGRPLIMKKSAPDFTGQLMGVPFEFDAKQFQGPSMALKMIAGEELRGHVVEATADQDKSGAVAGFLCLSTDAMRVFWLPGRIASAWLYSVRRGEAGTPKSLNFAKPHAWFAPHASDILDLGTCTGVTFDFAPRLDYQNYKGLQAR